MTEEIRYIANLQRQEEFDNEVTELKDELKRLEQENKQMKSALKEINILVKNYCNACDEFKAKTYKNKNDCLYCNYGFIKRKINEVLQ